MLTEQDKKWVKENIKEDEFIKNLENNMSKHTDFPVSITFTIQSPQGFDILFNIKGEDNDKWFKRMLEVDKQLVDNGFKPKPQRTFGQKPQKQTRYVGKPCPKCKSPLIYFESKGKEHIKCSTSKYDWQTKKSTGCDYVLWADSPKGNGSDFPDRVTPAQVNLIKKLQEEGRMDISIDITSLSKKDANDLISSVVGK